MRPKKDWEKPAEYNYPFFTSNMVASILGMNPNYIRSKKEKYATEVVPGEYLWTEEQVLDMINRPVESGKRDIYKYSSKWKNRRAD